MGLIQPIIIGLKILMQSICKDKWDWGEILSQKLLNDWHNCLTKLENFGSIETHRRFEIGKSTKPVVKRELHDFCDGQFKGLWGLYLY